MPRESQRQSQHGKPQSEPQQVKATTSVYRNPNYGYAVQIPHGLRAAANPPPLPNHGIKIPLRRKPEAYIWVDGSYNAAEYPSVRAAMDEYVRWLHREGTGVSVQRSGPSSLGTLGAVRFVVEYTGSESRVIEDVVIALRSETTGVGFMYTVGLRSSRSGYARDKVVLDAVLRGFAVERTGSGR